LTGPRAIALGGERRLTVDDVVAVARERRPLSLDDGVAGALRRHAAAAGAGQASFAAGRA
jgi:hypothetical protein